MFIIDVRLLEELLKCLLNLDFLEGFDDVANHDVVVALNAKSALITTGNLLSVVLEALERCQVAGETHDTVANETHLASTLELTLRHYQ